MDRGGAGATSLGIFPQPVADSRPTLDFVVIGAPKAGTTSLFEYLRTHPQVHLPKWKETNFFLDPTYQRGVEWYLDWVLSDAPAGAVCGEASVRYMAGTPYSVPAGTEPSGGSQERDDDQVERILPRRIHEALPGAKLIAILRDPVERSVSEHGMASLRGEEQRDLAEAMRESLRADRLEAARESFSTTTCYLVQSEYGRILAPFFELFGKDRILVLFTADLAEQPRAVVQEVCRFLGVADDFTPPNLGVRYLEGAAKPRWWFLDMPRFARFMKRSSLLRGIWRRLPAGLRQRVWSSSFAVEKWNRAAPEKDAGRRIDADLEATLREHFRADRERLVDLTGLEPPWA